MPRTSVSVGFLGLLLTAILLCPAPAGAQNRTFVSGTGKDANPCTLEAPCRTLQRGINRVDPRGEVVVVDSASYAPFTVAKAVTVVAAPGIHAGITATTGNGITVNAGPTDVVVLRGLTLIGMGGSTGILLQAGQALHVEHTVISGFSSVGIVQSAGQLVVQDTVIRDTTGDGVIISGTAAEKRVSLERVQLVGNTSSGLVAFDNSRVTIRDCVAASNGSGLQAFSVTVAAELNIENCMLANNGFGIISRGVSGVSVVRVSNATVTGNGTGLFAISPSQLLTRGNNTLAGNGTNGAFTGTFSGK